MSAATLLPEGESLRRAVEWIGRSGKHDMETIAEASRRFDLTPIEEAFLVRHFLSKDTMSHRHLDV